MTIVTCPRCNGRGLVYANHPDPWGDMWGPESCPLLCERGWHSLPLRPLVALLDLESRGQLAEFYVPDGVPDLDEMAA